jgi:hypothetical protein
MHDLPDVLALLASSPALTDEQEAVMAEVDGFMADRNRPSPKQLVVLPRFAERATCHASD